VAKKDGKRRIVQDYKYVNKSTIKNRYLLLLIFDILDRVGKKKVFMKLNLQWDYNNVRIKKGDEWKAVFTTHIGAYEPTVIYFGLTNSSTTFQTMMNNIFYKEINKREVGVFIDDILVGTKVVEGVLRKLEENDLFVKPEKYKWKVRKIEFLEVGLGPRIIEMEKVKMKGVLDWSTPKKVKDVQKFLGLANHYRQFIKDFAKVVQPLHMLVKKAEKWRWKKKQEKMFKMLKQAFT